MKTIVVCFMILLAVALAGAAGTMTRNPKASDRLLVAALAIGNLAVVVAIL